MLRGVRSGLGKLVYNDAALRELPEEIVVSSPAFSEGETIPLAYTADGDGVSPPLRWTGLPPETAAVAIIVEDADSPTPKPLVHAIAWEVEAAAGSIEEAGLQHGNRMSIGRNSYQTKTYVPMDPPPGHGTHRYVFQVYALSQPLRSEAPGRGELIAALRQYGLARGCLTGTFERRT